MQPDKGIEDKEGGIDPCDGFPQSFPVLRQVEQKLRGRAQDREAAQAGGAGCDADGHTQGQEAFAALGFPSENPHSLIGPEVFNEPPGVLLLCSFGLDWRTKKPHRARRRLGRPNWFSFVARFLPP